MKEPDYFSNEYRLEMFHAFLSGKQLEESTMNCPMGWSEWRPIIAEAPWIESISHRYRIKPTQETMDYAAWQEWEKDLIRGGKPIDESNFRIWKAALAWKRSKNG